HFGFDSGQHEDVPVTIGFWPDVCRECRGLPPEPHPVAEIFGRTTKLRRYYWRELFKRELELFAEWAISNGKDILFAKGPDAEAARKAAASTSVKEITELHQTSPKFTFLQEES